MKIDVLTIFPKMFDNVLNESIIKRAKAAGYVNISIYNLRNWTYDKHRTVDDKPFGGGPGMVIKPEPLFEAIEDLLGLSGKAKNPVKKLGSTKTTEQKWLSFFQTKLRKSKSKIILLTPQGEKLTQGKVKELAKYKHLILICGHYEGIDERVRLYLVTDEVSIGDYVLTCGELPAMVLIDCIVRLLPGVLGHKDSPRYESFENGLLEYPQYTRPADYRGLKVPEVLLSGNHRDIARWRYNEALKRTLKRRPDLIKERKRQ